MTIRLMPSFSINVRRITLNALTILIYCMLTWTSSIYAATVITNWPNEVEGGTTLGANDWKALMFTAGQDAVIDSVDLGLNPLTTAVPARAQVEIALYAVANNNPTTQISTTGLLTVEIPALMSGYNFQLGSAFTLRSSEKYALVIRSGAAQIKWGRPAQASTPASSDGFDYIGFRQTLNAGTSWTTSTSTNNAIRVNTHTINASITASSPSTRFIQSSNGTVTDSKTGLMWMRCSLGQTFTTETCINSAITHTWSEALTEAASSNFAGYTDWRLPNKKELASIVEEQALPPSINTAIFPETGNQSFWTSSPDVTNTSASWNISFGTGEIGTDSRGYQMAARLVRSGKCIECGDPQEFLVTTIASNGAINSTKNPTIANGSGTTVTGIAIDGFYFTGVSGCGGDPQNNALQSVTTFTHHTASITAPCTVTATFAPKTVTLTTTANNGTITTPVNPSTTIGQTVAISGAANTGYYFASVSGCGGAELTNANQAITTFTYNTGPVSAACTVTANFALKSYQITANASGSGEIVSPAGSLTVSHGNTTTLSLQAFQGHYVTGVSGCNGSTLTNTDQTVTTYEYTTGPVTAPCNVTASFAPQTYTVTTSTSNGTITSTTNPTVNSGEQTTVTGAASENYYFASITGCGGEEQGNSDQSVTTFSYTTGTITEACTVTATFALKSYAVNAIVNGGIAPTPSQMVQHGSITTVSVTGYGNHYLENISGCGGTPISNSDQQVNSVNFTTGEITSDCTVTANFSPIDGHYAVTTTAIDGSITSIQAAVASGETVILSGSANVGYYFSSIVGCGGVEQTNTDQSMNDVYYETGNITESCTVTATFLPKSTYQVSASATNGTITSAQSTPVVHGNTASITGVASEGYYFTSVSGCSGLEQTNSDQTISSFTYETGQVTSNCAVEATFDIKTYTVYFNLGDGQLASGNPAELYQIANHGSGVAAPSVIPPPGKTFTGWDVDFSSVTSNLTVTAQYQDVTFTITTNVTNGVISPANPSVASGSTVTFSGTANPGYYFSSASGCDGAPINNMSYSTTTFTYNTAGITSNCVITAIFTEIPKPNDLVGTAENAQVKLSWSPVASATGYHLYYATMPDFNASNYSSAPGGTWVQNVTSPHTVINLINNTTYYFAVTALHSTVESNISNKVSLSPTAGGRINDTGITVAADATTTYAACAHNTGPLQDCGNGRDVIQNDPDDGILGFSYTKLNNAGNLLPANATGWNCVKDNVTGLIWEVKTNDNGLHHAGWTYSWYDSNPATNGGNPGTPDAGNACFVDTRCDTEKFVADVNTAGLCGANDWRLPTMHELKTLMNHSGSAPHIDTSYFPHMANAQYRSSNTVVGSPADAWVLDFSLAKSAASVAKSGVKPVILVRGGN